VTEKLIFETSGHIKDKFNIEEIELWGHDAGEFVEEIIEIIQNEDKKNITFNRGADQRKAQ